MESSHETLRRWMLRRGYSPATAKLYAGCVRRFEASGHDAARCLIEQAQDYALTLPNTYASRAAFQNSLRAYWKMISRDKAALNDLPVPPRPEMICQALEDDELPLVLARAKDFGVREHAAACLLYYGGLRVHEAARMRWDWDRGDEMVVVQKGNRPKWLPIGTELRQALDAVPRTSEWVFTGRGARGPVSTETIRQWLRLAGAAAQLGRVRPHQLRHTCLAKMNDELGDLRATAEYAGHSRNSLSVTMGYTRTRKDRLRACAAVL